MARNIISKTQGNSSSTTLSSSVTATDTSFPLTSDTAFAGEGMVIIDEGTASEEYAYATAKVGASLTIPLANRGLEGTSATAHSAGATIKGILTAQQWNDIHTTLSNAFTPATGAVDATKILPTSYLDTDGTLAANSDSKIATQKAVKTYVDNLPPSASFWTSFTGAYASATTITVSGVDMTSIFKKGVALKWLSSADVLKIGKVVSSSFSTDTTITVVGSTVASGDKTFKYATDVMSETFIIAGNQSTGTNVSKTWTAKTDIYPISVDAVVSTAGTTNSTTYDLNDDSVTVITTKPSIASAATSDLDNVVDAPTTAIAVNSLVTVDIDAASTTQAIDGYVTLFYIPTWWVSRT